MSEIRPNLPAVSPVSASPVTSAQAAFFKAALANVQATQGQPNPPRSQENRSSTSVQQPSQPTRMARPGSLLDIRV